METITTTRNLDGFSDEELIKLIPPEPYLYVKDGDVTIIRDGTHTIQFIWRKGKPVRYYKKPIYPNTCVI